MAVGEIINTFENGLNPEALDSLSVDGTYVSALNAVHSSRNRSGFGLVNEESNELAVDFGVRIVGWSHINRRNQTLYFLADDSLWLHNHVDDTKTFVCRSSEFGCNWNFKKCEFLYGEFKNFNHCEELHVYWSSDCIYHVVNIDEMLDRTRKASVIACEDCSYFDVFKATCGPHLSATPVLYSGSALEAGTYQFAVQLEDNDGNSTNVFDISQPAVVESEDNIAGQPAKASVRFTMDNLSNKYDKVILYVIKTVRGVTVIEKMLDTLPYSDKGLTYIYYGQKGELVDSAVLTTKAKGFLRGQDLIQKDGRMFFYNIKNERNLNYQKYANQIQVEWVEWEVSMEQQRKYHFPGLMRGEVYAIGIVWRFLDGTYSHVFHIPAGGGGGGGGTGFARRAQGSGSKCYDANGKEIDCVTDGDPSAENPIGGGGGGEGASGSGSDTYNPLDPSMLDTEEQFERKRNPSEVKDRPNESDQLEEFTLEDVQNIDTDRDDMVQSAACHGNLYGCGEAEEAMDEDIDDLSNTHENNAELLALFGRDYPDPDLNQTSDIKEAGEYLIDNAVINREYVTRKKPVLNYAGANSGGPGGSPEEPVGESLEGSGRFSQTNVGVNTIAVPRSRAATNRGDNWVDSLGNNLTDEPIRKVASGSTRPYVSTVAYPDDKDCDGNRFYPGGNVRHHQIPWSSERPHFVSFQNGVVNKYQPENYEYGKTFVRPMGLQLSGIKFPEPDELPKPLCPNSPFKIVYVQRTDQNKSVFAKGWCSGMFQGEVYGTTYNYPRHGVNSFETVDRFIAAGDGNSRMGYAGGDGAYTFHSPDTDCDDSFLPVTHVKAEGELLGSGWRHGLYAEGKKVPENQFHGTRKDQRGARVANNINHFVPGGGFQSITGITYAPGDSVVTPASGISTPLMNKFRESSVYMECGSLPGGQVDKSFAGDVMDHFCPTKANAPYAALVRKMPDQYGGVEGLRYSDLGLNATKAHSAGNGTIEGVCGDTFIGPYSKRRTSYVSNKVGDFFHPPPKPGSPCRERSWCDSADDKIFQYFGIDHYPTKLPKSGDKWDPKNYAGTQTEAGECGALGHSKKCSEVGMSSITDFYWPRTLKSLVHCVVESSVNPWLRETGHGSQLEDGKVWYPKLKDLHLDPDAPTGHPWEETYLGRFYEAVEQPSRAVVAKKTLIRTLLGLGGPTALLTQFQDMQGIVDVVSTFFIFPMIAAFWIMGTNTLFTDRRINQMLGIHDCRRDEEGGDLDEHIENWEDNYCAYNWDYSKVNDLQPYHAFPLPYITCPCDRCLKPDLNNLIYHSNKQNLDSDIDAYRHVRLNNYTEIPGNAGKIQRLFKQGNGFYAHATDGIWILKYGAVSLPQSVAHQVAGTGELLAEPQLIYEGPYEGYAGTQHPNAAINTSMGYFFVDDTAEKIYRFNGTAEEISAYGMRSFFKENLPFCDTTSCYDEKTSDDNHYSLGWDPRYERLLVTKYDGNRDSSWTLSYTPLGKPTGTGSARGKWISFHSYIPNGYNWDRNNFYSIKGSGVWKHHKKHSYQTFYGELFPFMVQQALRAKHLEAFDFQDFTLDTEAKKWLGEGFVKDLDITFNKMAAWNSTQSTGMRPIEWISDNPGERNSQLHRTTHDPSKIRFHKVRRNWNIKEIRDLVITGCADQPMLLEPPCRAIGEINESIVNCEAHSKQDYVNRIFSDKHLNYRFAFDVFDNVRLYVKMIRTRHDEKILDK